MDSTNTRDIWTTRLLWGNVILNFTQKEEKFKVDVEREKIQFLIITPNFSENVARFTI